MNREDCFSLLSEQHITFPPTYKFKIGTDSYELLKENRKPSWCDRILFKMNKTDNFINCKPLSYFSLPNFTQSDHKPVCGLFEIRVIK
jgi:phosphatidylinositol-bisphosphatase